MTLRHTNPSRPRRDRNGHTYAAHAPYNFVPLPPAIVPAPGSLPPRDRYDEKLLTGHIDCVMETCSPTYIRGPMEPEDFKDFGEAGPDSLTKEQKEKRAPFFATDRAQVEGRPVPLIPGSSLRGMVRALVEIIGHGRMRWVGDKPTFTFRAVAASRDDPLREPYRGVIGAFGKNVRAGYLDRRSDGWYVRPALTPKDMGWPSDDAYLKVKDRNISRHSLPDYIQFDDARYRPQIHEVKISVEVRSSVRGRYPAVTQIAPAASSNLRDGAVLVCSGNMNETSQAAPRQHSPRKSQAVVLGPNPQAQALKIRPQAIDDYKAGLTRFQQEELRDWSGNRSAEMGCLGQGKPVFFVAEGKEVVYFGHSPNFRIPARLFGSNRAATPPDFIPDALRGDPQPDLADAIFGWVEEPDGPKEQRAGRVSFGDARFVDAADGVWLHSDPLVPRTLSGPKVTTFQHYLVQDQSAGHDPNLKETLAHYGSTPGSTELRGYKLFWHRGANPPLEATAKEREHETQLTRIIPLKPGVRFKFTIHFESLRREELGALWWALTLPGVADKVYRHKLGMGKPLGMGAVKLIPVLYVSHRTGAAGRYGHLFTDDAEAWHTPEAAEDGAAYAQDFERHVLSRLGRPSTVRFADTERIRMLLAMMEWREGTEQWLRTTSYMEVEAGDDRLNEYKERPVLPDPFGVVRLLSETTAHPEQQAGRSTATPAGLREITSPSAASRTSDLARHTGTVKQWVLGKTFGFIAQDGGGDDVFVHVSEVEGAKPLSKGQKVSYTTIQSDKGLKAAKVRLV